MALNSSLNTTPILIRKKTYSAVKDIRVTTSNIKESDKNAPFLHLTNGKYHLTTTKRRYLGIAICGIVLLTYYGYFYFYNAVASMIKLNNLF